MHPRWTSDELRRVLLGRQSTATAREHQLRRHIRMLLQATRYAETFVAGGADADQLYEILKQWAAKKVGWDADPGWRIDGGYEELIDYIAARVLRRQKESASGT